MKLWHGGVDGLRVGDLLEPSPPKLVPGCAVCAAHAHGQDHPLEPATKHPDRIYLTTDREYARFYASKYVYGDLYQVEPIGTLEWSTEDPFPTWKATSARITAVYARAVRLTNSQRRALLRRWPDPGSPSWPAPQETITI